MTEAGIGKEGRKRLNAWFADNARIFKGFEDGNPDSRSRQLASSRIQWRNHLRFLMGKGMSLNDALDQIDQTHRRSQQSEE